MKDKMMRNNNMGVLSLLAFGWASLFVANAQPAPTPQPNKDAAKKSKVILPKKPGEITKPETPNIIFIVVDDLGWGDLGSYGQKLIKTPYIDKLSSEGMRFTQFYAGAPLGNASRCC